MQVNGFALSSQKTVFVPLHTNTSQNTEVHIRVNGQSIFASKEVKYLGVHFTRWGRTNQQVAHSGRRSSTQWPRPRSGTIPLPPVEVFFPGIPTYLAHIMHRLHVGVWRIGTCVPTKCECGMSVSFHHVMFSCTSCSDHFQPLTGKLRSVGLPLCTKSLAVCDQREGWSRLRAAARLVYTCPLAAYL